MKQIQWGLLFKINFIFIRIVIKLMVVSLASVQLIWDDVLKDTSNNQNQVPVRFTDEAL